MTGKSRALAPVIIVLAAGLLIPALLVLATSAAAFDARVQVAQGLPAAEGLTVSRNEGGTPVTVVRGAPSLPAPAPVRSPVAIIDGIAVNVDSLEPTGSWFLDRSQDRLVVVHCYTRRSVYVGGGRRILCDALKL